MKWLKYMIFLVILLPALAQAQYRGSGRPLSRQETLDSLAAKLDTSAVAAGDNVTVDWDGSSLTIASSGGGGGSNWNPADSTLSLDLSELFNWNAVSFENASRDDSTSDSNWANYSAGVHTDNTATGEFLVGTQSIKITIPSGGQEDGAYLDITNTNCTQTMAGDTLTGWYALISIHILTQDITDLGSSSLQFLFSTDEPQALNNAYYTNFTAGMLTNGFNHFKVAMSAFSTNGSPNWNDIRFICVKNTGIATDAEVVFSFDHIALVRGIDGEPNPWQIEGPDGTWTAVLTQEGNGNGWIVKESGRLSAMTPEASHNTSYLKSSITFGDFSASGVFKAANESYMLQFPLNYGFRLNSGNVQLRDSTAVRHSIPFAWSVGDIIHWKYHRKGTSIIGEVSLTGLDGDWTTVSTFGFAGTKMMALTFDDAHRLYTIGLSAVEYAAEAGMAYRWYRGFERGDTLFITNVGAAGDSLGFILFDGYVKE